jgi:hypothetical protein
MDYEGGILAATEHSWPGLAASGERMALSDRQCRPFPAPTASAASATIMQARLLGAFRLSGAVSMALRRPAG